MNKKMMEEKTTKLKEGSNKRKREQPEINPARKKRKLSQVPSLEEIKSQDPSLEKIKKLQETCNFVYLASDFDKPEYVNVKKVNLLGKG